MTYQHEEVPETITDPVEKKTAQNAIKAKRQVCTETIVNLA